MGAGVSTVGVGVEVTVLIEGEPESCLTGCAVGTATAGTGVEVATCASASIVGTGVGVLTKASTVACICASTAAF